MAKNKWAKPKSKPKREQVEPRFRTTLELSLYEIPLIVINWLGKTPGKHCLVILQTPDGSQYSVELYDVPVSTGDAIVGTAQSEELKVAFNGAIANYNLNAAAKGRQDFIV